MALDEYLSLNGVDAFMAYQGQCIMHIVADTVLFVSLGDTESPIQAEHDLCWF